MSKSNHNVNITTEESREEDFSVSMKTYFDDIVGKKMFVCEDGCNTTTNPEWTLQQCLQNTSKECMFIFHNKHCICNK